MKLVMYISKTLLALLFTQAVATSSAYAGPGFSGSVVPNGVHLEAGTVYIHGNFGNPEQCATSSMVVLQAANEKELDRMVSMALTAAASGKKISMWIIGCVPVPWFASAPRAVTMMFEK